MTETTTPGTLSPLSRDAVVSAIGAHRYMVVLRARSAADALWGADVLIQAGIRVLEVTSTIPGFGEVIATVRDAHPDVLVGRARF